MAQESSNGARDLHWHDRDLGPTTTMMTATVDGEALSWRALLEAWLDGNGRRFSARLAGHPAAACFWECPPLTRCNLDDPFECVLVTAQSLATTATDPQAFAAYFSANASACTFPNLGGDATLVAPCPAADTDASHLLAWCRTASPEAQAELWREVASLVLARIGDQPRWLSTSGLGVAWLHVRWDRSPKYYQHAPYRSQPGRR